eukprot:4568965-Pleurochrysis_carterae.AAC.3
MSLGGSSRAVELWQSWRCFASAASCRCSSQFVPSRRAAPLRAVPTSTSLSARSPSRAAASGSISRPIATAPSCRLSASMHGETAPSQLVARSRSCTRAVHALSHCACIARVVACKLLWSRCCLFEREGELLALVCAPMCRRRNCVQIIGSHHELGLMPTTEQIQEALRRCELQVVAQVHVVLGQEVHWSAQCGQSLQSSWPRDGAAWTELPSFIACSRIPCIIGGSEKICRAYVLWVHTCHLPPRVTQMDCASVRYIRRKTPIRAHR